jgi:hypothetical protein
MSAQGSRSAARKPIRVKFLYKSKEVDATPYWVRAMPNNSTLLGACHFIFNRDLRDYDWLVVLDDLPSKSGERFTLWEEPLACHPENTVLITLEPTPIKAYGQGFMAQFGHVLSSQEPFAIRHRHHIQRQCGLPWFYGKSYAEASSIFPAGKRRQISTVCSTKKQKHTLHWLRHQFTEKLKVRLPDLEVFGHGHRFIETKVEALDPFEYHLAIENHLAPHHWTEKLADAFLGGCFPLYFGAPNVFDYFPEESLCLIDIRQTEAALDQISAVLRDHNYTRALPAIREARRRILEEYALFPMLAKLLPDLHQSAVACPGKTSIVSRHAWRRRYPVQAIGYGIERFVVRKLGQRSTRLIAFPKSVGRVNLPDH